jgi:alpha-L-fucosidase
MSRLAVVTSLFLLGACAETEELDRSTVAPTVSGEEARMQWWREARFGLFIHWGLYAIPAGEWKGETGHAEWIRESAHIPVDEYEKFLSQWNPVKFDADAWVAMAKAAGMKYVVITSKHHDGYCNFDSALTDWDVMSTPFHRDVMKEMAEACRRQGMKICWYHSIMDWHHPDYLPRRTWEAKDRPADGADYTRFRNYLAGEVTELLTKYGPIGVMWFDGEWENTWKHEYGVELYQLCRRLQPDVIVNNRVDVGRSGMQGMTKSGEFVGDFGTPEQEIPATGLPGVDWETCMTMNDHWGFNSHDTNWKSTSDLVRKLVDVASKGGNFLLNVGPRADGTFPPEAVQRLAEIGRWMDVNGDAIHGTRASPFDELPFGRCTVKVEPRADGSSRTRLFFHVFDWPKDGHLLLPPVGNRIVRASLLADPSRELEWALPGKDVSQVVVNVPAAAPDPVCSVVVLEIVGAPVVYRAPKVVAASDSFVNLLAVDVDPRSSGVVVRYTLDGSEPSASSPRYEMPLDLVTTTTVKARTFAADGVKPVSETTTRKFEKVTPWPAVAAGGAEPKPGVTREVVRGTKFERVPEPKKLAALVAGAKAAGAATVVPTIDLGEFTHQEVALLHFAGSITVPDDELYRFALTSDDGSKLWIDGKLVVDDDGCHAPETKEGIAPLARGSHRIEVAWFNAGGGAELELKWAAPGQELVVVPAAVLSH